MRNAISEAVFEQLCPGQGVVVGGVFSESEVRPHFETPITDILNSSSDRPAAVTCLMQSRYIYAATTSTSSSK